MVGAFFFSKRRKNLLDALMRSELFQGMSKRQIAAIQKFGHIRRYTKEELIFSKDDTSYGIFLILEGEVSIQGKRQLALLKKNDHFGIPLLTNDAKRLVSAYAKTEVICCYFFKKDLEEIFLKYPQISITYYENILKIIYEQIDQAFLK